MQKINFWVIATLLCSLTPPGYSQNQSGTTLPTASPISNVQRPAVKIQQLQPDVWIHTSHFTLGNGTVRSSNGIIVREDDHLFLIDPAWGVENTRQLLQNIESQIGLPIKLAISTHHHDDRTLGLNVLKKAGVTVVAHPLTLKLALLKGKPIPDMALFQVQSNGASIKIGPLDIFYPGPGHAPDNITVWLEKQKILYAGCLIRDMQSSTLGNTVDANLLYWPTAIQKVQQRYKQVDLIVPGHGNTGGIKLFNHMLGLFDKQK